MAIFRASVVGVAFPITALTCDSARSRAIFFPPLTPFLLCFEGVEVGFSILAIPAIMAILAILRVSVVGVSFSDHVDHGDSPPPHTSTARSHPNTSAPRAAPALYPASSAQSAVCPSRSTSVSHECQTHQSPPHPETTQSALLRPSSIYSFQPSPAACAQTPSR